MIQWCQRLDGSKPMLGELQQRKLIKLFSMNDTTFSGSIARQDFETIIKRIAYLRNWSLRSPRYQILNNKYLHNWEALRKKADVAHDQRVSLAEWLAYQEAVMGDRKQYAEEVHALMEVVFDSFDRDEDGKIRQQEWGDFLSVHSISPVYAAQIFPTIDTNQDGFLTKDEVLKLIQEFYYSDNPEDPANFMFGPY